MVKYESKTEREGNDSMKENLKIYMQTFRFLDESTEDYFYLYDLEEDRLYFTDKICEKYPLLPSGKEGITMEEWNRHVYEKDQCQLMRELEKIRNGCENVHDMEYRLIDQEGNKVWVSERGTVQKDEDGNPCLLIGSVSELALGRQVDNLTGLWNYDKFMDDMGKCLQEESGYLMVFGIDNFKHINLKNGRTFGNYLLKFITEILEKYAEYPMKVYRLNGDCFGVNFPEQSKNEVVNFYHAVKGELEQHCTISAGVVAYKKADQKDCGVIYQYAENALDRAKKGGKNTLVFFSSEDYQKNLERIRLQDEMRESVRNDFAGFYLCYQPQIDSNDFHIYGAEALLRYESASRGIVRPDEFIPILEQSGMICQTGMWVLKTAMLQCLKWRETLADFHISVNISYVQLRQNGITEQVLELLSETGLPGDALTLEVTESMQLQDYPYFNKIFYEWKRHGIKIAIDDFGTGYSSLSYLKSIDIDETKIDRCFVSRLHYNAYNYRLLSNMIELAHSAKIRVCCEGVETEEELLALRELKPDILQGFYFARPFPKEEFERYYILRDTKEYRQRIAKESRLLSMQEENKSFLERLRQEELGNIVDGMDEIIYVSDPETYDLYYLNSSGRKLTGMYDYKGRKCYKILHGRDQPCEFCTNGRLHPDKLYVWEMENSYFGRRFMLKDKLIPWQGKMARLEVAVDITGCLPFDELTQKHACTDISRERLEQVTCDYEEVLGHTRLGIWEIRIDMEHGRYEMYIDPIMGEILGLKEKLTPEACYAFWYNRIKEGYYHYVNLAVENIIETGKTVQVEYTWNHPERGEVTVRCMAVRTSDKDGCVCMEGYHRIISDLERPYFLPGGLDSEMFEYNEKTHAIYFHTGRNMLAGTAVKEENFPECWLKEGIVHPHFAEEFGKIFEHVREKKDSGGRVMRFLTKSGEYEWFSVKTRHLGTKEEASDTIIILIDRADQKQAVELAYMRKKDFYEALISETVANVEVDVESNQVLQSGGLWKFFETVNREEKLTFDRIIESYAASAVCTEDESGYKRRLNTGYMKEMHKKGARTEEFCFRRYMHGELYWMKLVIHVFEDSYTENMYALLYLKNIDAEKKREMAQELAAERDPLTNAYNRKVFENEVIKFMEKDEKETGGALMLIDLDDFKQVNDKFGHLKGDEMLKALVDILRGTFRSDDLIGRLGGDEFLVFVKGISDREILDKRMEELFSKLEHAFDIPVACSAGISIIKGREFKYKKELGKADAALYESKRTGKNRYRYYEE